MLGKSSTDNTQWGWDRLSYEAAKTCVRKWWDYERGGKEQCSGESLPNCGHVGTNMQNAALLAVAPVAKYLPLNPLLSFRSRGSEVDNSRDIPPAAWAWAPTRAQWVPTTCSHWETAAKNPTPKCIYWYLQIKWCSDNWPEILRLRPVAPPTTRYFSMICGSLLPMAQIKR